MSRIKTKYPGVYYRETQRIGGNGKEKVYYIVFKQDAKMIEEKVGRQYVDDMTEARASKIRAERIEGKRLSRKKIREVREAEKQEKIKRWTFNRLWQEYKSRKPYSKSLSVDDNRYKNYIQPNFGEKEPSEISQFEIDKLRVTLLKSKKPQTVKHILAQIVRISNFAVKKNLCDGLSFHVELPRVNNKITEDLTNAQLQALLDTIEQEKGNNPAANMMLLALNSGMRRSEMFRLKWSDLDFKHNFIYLRDPKGGANQVIPMNESSKIILQNQSHTKSPYVFPDKDGGQRYQITREANRIKKLACLPDDFRAMHGLRHVYASMLASSGEVDMYTLQKLLTHKSPLMTQRYVHLRDKTLRRASNLAGELINQAINGE